MRNLAGSRDGRRSRSRGRRARSDIDDGRSRLDGGCNGFQAFLFLDVEYHALEIQ
jgi:hypothetical protein